MDHALQCGRLHEVIADHEQSAACIGFGLLMVQRAAPGRVLMWVREDHSERHDGRVYPPGLAELGIDPTRLILICARDTKGLIEAARDAVHCDGIGAVMVEAQDRAIAVDLTATRRLALAAERSNVTIVLVRLSDEPGSSVARTRWRVASAPSMPLEGDAPGHPSFAVELVRDRGGTPPFAVRLEWDRDQMAFRQTPLSGDMAAVPAERADQRAA